MHSSWKSRQVLFLQILGTSVLGVKKYSSLGPLLQYFIIKVVKSLSNGYSPANLANSSTRAKLAVFGECETRQTRRHSPSRVARTRQNRRLPPSRVARTRQTRRHSPSRVARTRQTRERRVGRVLREFSESGEFGEFGECRLDRFIHIKYVICA
jgi:hypothetical protein